MVNNAYANYRDFQVIYCLANHTFDIRYGEMGTILESVGVHAIWIHGEKAFDMGVFSETSWTTSNYSGIDGNGILLQINYGGGCSIQKDMSLSFLITQDRVRIRYGCRGDLDLHMSGQMHWGAKPDTDTFPVHLNRSGPDLRAAIGPAASSADNALFDRATDSALEVLGCRTFQLDYDWDQSAYRFRLNTEGNDVVRGFQIQVHKNVYANRFGVPYKPYNRNSTFGTPPAGWMTWYAVQFKACEDAVLENARWMAENLKKYGANCIWVDWEWYHQDFSGTHKAGVDVFHPDLERYPHGLAHVAEEIGKLGLIPAIWIGATNDVNKTDFIGENPDAVLCVKPSWCGSYFLDPSHPRILDEYIPKAFNQLLDWGYQALKWDCFPITVQYCDANHDRFYDQNISTEEALRGLIQKARDTVGENYYMLSCSGDGFRQISMAMDIFDAMRIGGDIFDWPEFVSQCIERVMKYYVYHNVICLNDPDNLVIRPQYNTYDEAVSRVSLVGLLGLPVNYGDDLPALPDDRIELLRRITPPLDIHPVDVREQVFDGRIVKIGLTICKPYEQWSILDILNIQDQAVQVQVNLRDDLHLDVNAACEYLVFDFWNKQYLGAFRENIAIELRAHASRLLAVRRKLDRPQIVSTSRHITQGAAEIKSMAWDNKKNILSGISAVVDGESYEIFIRIPCEFAWDSDASTCQLIEKHKMDIYRVLFPVSDNQDIHWQIAFTKTEKREGED